MLTQTSSMFFPHSLLILAFHFWPPFFGPLLGEGPFFLGGLFFRARFFLDAFICLFDGPSLFSVLLFWEASFLGGRGLFLWASLPQREGPPFYSGRGAPIFRWGGGGLFGRREELFFWEGRGGGGGLFLGGGRRGAFFHAAADTSFEGEEEEVVGVIDTIRFDPLSLPKVGHPLPPKLTLNLFFPLFFFSFTLFKIFFFPLFFCLFSACFLLLFSSFFELFFSPVFSFLFSFCLSLFFSGRGEGRGGNFFFGREGGG